MAGAYGERRPFQAQGAYLRTRGLGPDFARLWTANAVSNLGDGVTLVAERVIGWLGPATCMRLALAYWPILSARAIAQARA